MTVTNYRDLIAWQKAMDLTVAVYELSEKFPREEIFGLTFQMRKAAVSVPSNIAEGQARRSTKEFSHHLSIALGSTAEIETQTFVAIRINYVTQTESSTVLGLATEVKKLVNGLMNSLETRPPRR
ncbi:MAG: four helix bundle protein [Pirellulales bacterium]